MHLKKTKTVVRTTLVMVITAHQVMTKLQVMLTHEQIRGSDVLVISFRTVFQLGYMFTDISFALVNYTIKCKFVIGELEDWFSYMF